MKKILCLLLVILTVLLTGCELPFVLDDDIENEVINELVPILSEKIDMGQYDPQDIGESVARFYYTGSHIGLPKFDNKVTLEDTTVIELGKTTIGNLIDNGFEVIDSEDYDSIWLSCNGKKLCVYRENHKDKVEDLVIESVNLESTDDYIDYEYHGVKKDSTLDSIVEIWGQPTYEIMIYANEELDGTNVDFSYFSLDHNMYVNFTYDEDNDRFIYDGLLVMN